MKKLEKVIQIIINTCLVFSLIAILFCASGFIQLKALKRPYVDFFGYTFFSVATGSMRPTLEVQDIIIVKITDDVKVGDVITYRDNKDFVTHRVVSNNKDKFITKGDYNNTEDKPIESKQVVGKMVCKIPNLGVMGKILLTPKVFVSIVVTLFLFCISFSYVPDNKKEGSLKTKFSKLFKSKKKNDDNLVKVIQSEKQPDLNLKEVCTKLNNKKQIDLGETAELFLNLKELEQEEKKIKDKLASKNSVKVKPKKKMDLDKTCEYVFAFNKKDK